MPAKGSRDPGARKEWERPDGTLGGSPHSPLTHGAVRMVQMCYAPREGPHMYNRGVGAAMTVTRS